MNRLKDTMEELIQEAPPIDDLADRALARARRRNRLAFGGAATGLAVAGVTAAVLVATSLPAVLPVWDGDLDAAGGERTGQPAERIDLPVATPDPLPDGAVGPVELAYALDCPGASDRVTCALPRVRTADGRHWRIADALAPELEEHGGETSLERRGGFALSPQGDRLAYVREDRSFVIRDLDTGEVTPLFEISRKAEELGDIEVRWSPDGRRLVLQYVSTDGHHRVVDQDGPAAMLVDAEAMEAIELPGACCVLAVPAGDRVVLMEDANDNARGPNWTRVLRIAPDGPVKDRLVYTTEYWARAQAYSPKWSAISPDGGSLAGISLVYEGREHGDGGTGTSPDDTHLELMVIDPETRELLTRHRLPTTGEGSADQNLLGWVDGSHVLVGAFGGDGVEALSDERPSRPGSDVYMVDVGNGRIDRVMQFGETKPALLSVAVDLL